MRKTTAIFIALISLTLFFVPASAVMALESSELSSDQPQPILITSLQAESASSGRDEFIELYNPNEQAIDITGWQVHYRSASNTSNDDEKWQERATLNCLDEETTNCTVMIEPKTHLLLASDEHATEQVHYPLKSGMASAGGQVRLVQPRTANSATSASLWMVEDLVGYGTAAYAEGNPPAAAPAPKPSNGITRKLDEETDEPIDTNNNAADFALIRTEAPADTSENNIPPATEPGRGAALDGQIFPTILITELLPDPASPAQDATDEFIELYNPNDTIVDLTDYTLQTGTNWRYTYTIEDLMLEPHGYAALLSADTRLVLSNSGTSAQLLDPAGNVIAATPNYNTAKSGQSWMLGIDGTWSWTTTPTPDRANELAAPLPKVSAASKKAATTAKKTTTKAAAAGAVKSADTASTGNQADPAATQSPSNYWFIGAGAALIGGYGVYEYRSDIATLARRLLGRFKRA